jgi:hypothetical protein
MNYFFKDGLLNSLHQGIIGITDNLDMFYFEENGKRRLCLERMKIKLVEIETLFIELDIECNEEHNDTKTMETD